MADGNPLMFMTGAVILLLRLPAVIMAQVRQTHDMSSVVTIPVTSLPSVLRQFVGYISFSNICKNADSSEAKVEAVLMEWYWRARKPD